MRKFFRRRRATKRQTDFDRFMITQGYSWNGSEYVRMYDDD